MNKKYKEYVNQVRKNMPVYNHGRFVVVLSEDTAKGVDILKRASRWAGDTLSQVYDNWSETKERAYNDAWEMYCSDPDASGFSICSANTFQFTVSWVTPVSVVYLTRDCEYHVMCNIPEFYR